MPKLQDSAPFSQTNTGTGQRVRVKATSQLALSWNVSPEALGTVLCRYKMLTRLSNQPERVDVRFDDQFVAWGCPADEFEAIVESPRQQTN